MIWHRQRESPARRGVGGVGARRATQLSAATRLGPQGRTWLPPCRRGDAGSGRETLPPNFKSFVSFYSYVFQPLGPFV